MLYLKSDDSALRIIVLETENLDRLKKGHVALTEDEEIVLAWTPDPDWLGSQILASAGDTQKIFAAIKEAATRPQAPPHAHHEPVKQRLGG